MTLPFDDAIEGKYEILGKLGEGGMGAVYQVRHRLLDEVRVIKLIQPHLWGGRDIRDRFLREARVAIQLRHPNVAQLHDFTVNAEGQAFIVMEYIHGLTLEEVRNESGPPPLGLGLEIAQQALRAIGYLHRKGFLHRDIAPDNLMLTRGFDEGPLVKLIDLGIARVLQGDQKLTSTGLFLGKPRYASPEQFEAEGSDGVDARSDLYSFGVVLYELLTGVYPIVGKNVPSLMAGHLFRPPVDFAVSDPQGKLPSELREILLQTLAKAPGERFATAEELAARLAPLQARFPLEPGELETALRSSAAPRLAAHAAEGTTQDRLDREFGPEPTPSPQARTFRNPDSTVVLPAHTRTPPPLAPIVPIVPPAPKPESTEILPLAPAPAPPREATVPSPVPPPAVAVPSPEPPPPLPKVQRARWLPFAGALLLLMLVSALLVWSPWRGREPLPERDTAEKRESVSPLPASSSPGKAVAPSPAPLPTEPKESLRPAATEAPAPVPSAVPAPLPRAAEPMKALPAPKPRSTPAPVPAPPQTPRPTRLEEESRDGQEIAAAPPPPEAGSTEGTSGRERPSNRKDLPPEVASIATPPADAQVTASGLASKVLKRGFGTAHPGPSDLVQVDYTAWTADGKIFDSSASRSKTTILPLDKVISGWSEGVQLMVPGETRRLWIPAKLAYEGLPNKPQGPLVFNVTLLNILPPERHGSPGPTGPTAPPPDAQRTASGLAFKILSFGFGARHPKEDSVVKVLYVIWKSDGKVFASSSSVPATFSLQEVFPGWREGVQLMFEGEVRQFWVPEKLAYKRALRYPAGPLVLQVKLLEIVKE